MKRESLIIAALAILMGLSIIASLRINRNTASASPTSITHSIENLGGRNGIAVVTIYGEISHSDTTSWMGGGYSADDIVNEIKSYESNPNVRALVLRINSPGGTVGAAQEIADAVMRFKSARPGVPVLASIGDMGASAAYWIACSTDTIVANPGSLVGSIGVILQQMDLTAVKDRYGVGMRTYKSGEYKDMLSGWRVPSSGEETVVQSILDNVHDQFITMVRNHRKLSDQQLELVRDAQVFTGEQAVAVGLVDRTGTFQKTLDIAAKQAKLHNPYIIQHPRNPFATLFAELGALTRLPALSTAAPELR